MPMTDVEIANLALVRMGIHKQLTALGDGSSEGNALGVLMPGIKRRVLEAWEWSWALRQVVLDAATGTPDTLPFGWTYAYDVPADLLRAVRLWDGARREPVAERLPFQIAPVDSGSLDGVEVEHTVQIPLYASTNPASTAVETGVISVSGVPTTDLKVMIWACAGPLETPGLDDHGESIALGFAVFVNGFYMEQFGTDLKNGSLDVQYITEVPQFDEGGSLTNGIDAGITITATGDFINGNQFFLDLKADTGVPSLRFLTDVEDAELVYVSNGWLASTPTVTAPDSVNNVVAWMLAAELAMPLAKRADLAGMLAQTARAELHRAIALDRSTFSPDPAPASAAERSRR